MTVNLKVPRLPKPKLPRLSKRGYEVAAQAVGVLSVLIGVSAWSVPCAFILGGATLILAIERQE